MSQATTPATYGPGYHVTVLCERYRGEGCYGVANRLREDEAMDARLAVETLQTSGLDAARFYLEEAAQLRATRYEFQATGEVLRELNAERLSELRRRNSSSGNSASYDAFGGA